MAKTFRSKIDIRLLLIIVAVFTILSIKVTNTQSWAIIITSAVVMLAMLGLILGLKYVISGDKLYIHYGIYFKRPIEIDKITKLSETRNPLSSPAASLDRIAIRYNSYDEVMISPKDKAEFIAELLKINNKITVA